jgi:hypothetical protein
VYNALLSQLSRAADQLLRLESQMRDTSDSEAVALLDREIQAASETVQNFGEALRIHVAICDLHPMLDIARPWGKPLVPRDLPEQTGLLRTFKTHRRCDTR